MKTFTLKKAQCEKKWKAYDARTMPLGRLASEVASRLKGKHKATYSPHLNCGDGVIIHHCENLILTGRKREQKIYYHHTGYMGGLKERTLDQLHEKRLAVFKAIERMLSKSRLRRQILRENLKLFEREAPDAVMALCTECVKSKQKENVDNE